MTYSAHIDFETRSTTDLLKSGVYRYCEDPHTDVWVMSWAVVDDERRLIVDRGRWRPNLPHCELPPLDLLSLVAGGARVVAHNAQFEFNIWNTVLRRKRVIPPLVLEQMDCTMARAAAYGWPLGLDKLTQAMRACGVKAIPEKDMEGHALMLRMCKPKFIDEDGTPHWHGEPEKIERLSLYCDRDVDAEYAVDIILPPLSESEKRVYVLDQIINARGVRFDENSIRVAHDVAQELTKRANERMDWLTDGKVEKVSQVKRLVDWVSERGIPCESVGKGDVADVIASAKLLLDETAAEAVELRRDAAKASTAKFTAMQRSVSRDGRGRGALQYHGAGPGRWAGRLWQPQNFTRVYEEDEAAVEQSLKLLGSAFSPREICDAMTLMFSKPFKTLSQCLRPMLVAGPNMKLIGGDYANIEGRLSATLVGEFWKMRAFREYDAGVGPDLYKVAYARSFGVDVSQVTKPQRQVGKVEELSLQYQGSVGAFINMGANYGVRPAEVAQIAQMAVSEENYARVWEKYEGARSYDLPQDVWTGIKIVIEGWRAAHPNTVQAWWDEQDAAIAAVWEPGVPQRILENKVTYLCASGYLFCQLPSGRVLSYVNPRISEKEDDFGRLKRTVLFDGLDGKTKQWCTQSLYGGLQHNNIVQGSARDILVEGMFRAEANGFPISITVHDELMAELLISAPHNEKMLEMLMAIPPAWAPDLPIAASCWEGPRYAK